MTTPVLETRGLMGLFAARARPAPAEPEREPAVGPVREVTG